MGGAESRKTELRTRRKELRRARLLRAFSLLFFFVFIFVFNHPKIPKDVQELVISGGAFVLLLIILYQYLFPVESNQH
jgi:hypothetical protein